jgi:hypothetical protein
MSWRTLRTGSKPSLSPPAWDNPTRRAELYLMKVPVDGTERSFACGKQVDLVTRLVNYIIVMMRRAGIMVSRRIASLLPR